MMEISEIKIEKEDEYDLETEIKVENEEIQYEDLNLFLVPEVEEIKQEPTIIHNFEITEIKEETPEVQASSLLNPEDPEQSKSPDRKFGCFYCDKKYLHKNTLREHISSQHRGFPLNYSGGIIRCRFCYVVYDDFDALTKHVLESHQVQTPVLKYECAHCGKRERALSILRQHMAKHTNERPYQCSICLKTFKNLYQRNNHQKNIHVTEKLFQCPECPKTFKSQKDLSSHRQVHNVGLDFKCTHCEKAFRTKKVLSRHISRHNHANKYPCKVCGKVFTTNSSLSRHIVRIHKSQKPQKLPEEKKSFKCSICSKSFIYQWMLQNHTLTHTTHITHTDEKPFKCQICPKEAKKEKSFRSREGLKYHMDSYHSSAIFTCSVCSKTFSGKYTLCQHMTDVHKPQKPPEERKSFNCSICSKSFKYQWIFLNHSLTHTAHTMHTEEKPFKCEICPKEAEKEKSYRSRAALQYHMDSRHSSKTFPCSVCSKTFPSRSNLNNHVRKVHSDKKRHECRICGKTFKNNLTLNFHIETHEEASSASGEIKPLTSSLCLKTTKNSSSSSRESHPVQNSKGPLLKYECAHCGKRERALSVLRQHIVKHSKERPHQCSICLKTFKSLNYRKDHQKTVHMTENLFQCPECPKTFKSRNNLNQHRQIHNVGLDFKCTVCGKGFKTKGGLRSHSIFHTDAKLPCKVCGKLFNFYSSLYKHVFKVHKSQKLLEHGKSSDCSICSKSFIYPSELRNHMFTHTGEKPFKCQICPKEAEGEVSFRSTQALKYHMNSFHDSKTFPCSVCSKTFSSRSNLNNHLRKVHSDKKRYECRICGKTFENNRELNCHIETHGEASSSAEQL